MGLKINSLRVSIKGVYPTLLILTDFETMERPFSAIKALSKSL